MIANFVLSNRFDAAYRLVFPLRQVALAQFYKYHHQCGNAASGKLVSVCVCGCWYVGVWRCVWDWGVRGRVEWV